MISWIKGDLVDLWQTNNKFFILINCHGLGYEIQILEYIYVKLKTKQILHHDIVIWLKHIKKEDSDNLFGFVSKDQKDFFIEILNVKGIGAQIGMSLLNKYSIGEIINAIEEKNKKLISSVPGIGNKMTERLFLELKSRSFIKSKNDQTMNINSTVENNQINSIFEELDFTLQSLSYQKNKIKSVFPILIKEIKNKKQLTNGRNDLSFEDLLKIAMNYLDKNNSTLGR